MKFLKPEDIDDAMVRRFNDAAVTMDFTGAWVCTNTRKGLEAALCERRKGGTDRRNGGRREGDVRLVFSTQVGGVTETEVSGLHQPTQPKSGVQDCGAGVTRNPDMERDWYGWLPENGDRDGGVEDWLYCEDCEDKTDCANRDARNGRLGRCPYAKQKVIGTAPSAAPKAAVGACDAGVKVTAEMIDRYLCHENGLRGPSSLDCWLDSSVKRAREHLDAVLNGPHHGTRGEWGSGLNTALQDIRRQNIGITTEPAGVRRRVTGNCSNCRFGHMQKCRRHAPLKSSQCGHPEFPAILEMTQHWCGDWESREN